MPTYLISGLRVASDLDLPGAILAEGTGAAPDVAIAQGPVPMALDPCEASGPNWFMAGERFVLRVPGIVRMELTGGHSLVWQCEDQTSPRDAAIFVSGSGFGLLMHQRGRCVIHASALAVGGRAVLFCGASGAGKSTLAAALAERGLPLLSDDQCVLSDLAAPLVHPDGRAMRLWDQAIDKLALSGRSGAAVREHLRKFHVEPPRAHGAALPLAAIYVLQEARAPELAQGGSGIAIEPLNLADAAIEVRRNAYRPAMIRRLGQEALYLQAAAGAAQAGGVFRLTRPLDFALFDRVIDALQAHWQQLGLVEPVP